MNTRMASAFTKPTITERGMKRMSRVTPRMASRIWKTPARITAAMRWSSPWLRISGAITRATAPVAAEIMAGRPPTKEMVTAMVKEANSPIRGSTPAITENAMASGMRARATTSPARASVLRRRGERSVARTDWSCSGFMKLYFLVWR
jgi:hypothetical protein